MPTHSERSNEYKGKKELLQLELDINKQTQKALQLRINAIKEYKEPKIATFFSQIYKDQIELDELKIRELELIELIKKELN
jgi:hypothetical protein